MSDYTFPYRTKRIDLGVVIDPLIPLHIKATYGWQQVWMLVDTGADTTTLPLSLAQKLGIAYNKSQKEKLTGIGDEIVYGYEASIQLKIAATLITVRAHLLDTNQQVLLLGRMDVFDHFSLLFDNKRKQIIFREI